MRKQSWARLPLYNRIAIPLVLQRALLFAMALSGLAGALTGCASQQPAQQQDKSVRRQQSMQPLSVPPGKEIATLAGGCFWCTEAIFRDLKGVEKVEPGYAGGQTAHPTYEQVCTGTTGHAEAIQITFDPKVISYHDLLEIFFTTHDPTTRNRQGADVGTQYRSAIFYHSPEQKETALQVIKEIEAARIWPAPIVTEVVPFTNFYPAEDYHRDYFERNPEQFYCQAVIAPKVAKFREHYRNKLKQGP
ncbi:MAG TPA: peptide-methionine (S)-S-oxide reductase MsrA [Chthonomonadaceae bacterium]|nr:peptide-methionine (S)-S-oxide reductase MsrA [Chthonomonadaceae bacterium]